MFKLLMLSVTMFTCAATALLAPRVVEAPDAALKGTVDELLANLEQHSARYRRDPAAFQAMVDAVVVPRFDVPGIAQFALGKHARTATPEQRQRFAEVLSRMLVRSYATLMLDRHDSMKVVWIPTRPQPRSDHARIDTVLAGNGTKYPVGFSMRLLDGEWRIYDLEIGGVSLALNYRAQLSTEIRRTSLEAVIARMTKQDPKLLVKAAAP